MIESKRYIAICLKRFNNKKKSYMKSSIKNYYEIFLIWINEKMKKKNSALTFSCFFFWKIHMGFLFTRKLTMLKNGHDNLSLLDTCVSECLFSLPDLQSTCATMSQLFILEFQKVPKEQTISVQWHSAPFHA